MRNLLSIIAIWMLIFQNLKAQGKFHQIINKYYFDKIKKRIQYQFHIIDILVFF